MIDFRYKARDKGTGRVISGSISADTELAAGKLLLKQDLYPIEIKAQRGTIFSSGQSVGKVKLKDRVIFTRQLSTLIKAGLPVGQALASVQNQVSNKKLQGIIFRLEKSVEGGSPLSQALEEYPQNFNAIYIALVQAGEVSGNLEKSLERLANQLEKEAEIVSKIRGALVYPGVVMVVILGVMGYMISSVVPQIALLYKSFNKDLPWLTLLIVGISDIFVKYWFIVLPMSAGVIYGIYVYIKSPNGRKVVDNIKLTMPPFNELLKKMYMARFARTLASLTSSGVPILESMRLVGESVNNLTLKAEVGIMIDEIKSGQALSESLAKTQYFLPLVSQMVKVGEESGTMGEMLDRLAMYYENEVDQIVKNISTLIEPVLIVFLGFMVMIIILGILYPVYSLVGGGIN